MSFHDRIDPLLAGSIERGDLVGVVATVESSSEQLYAGAAGHFERDGSGPAYGIDTPLRIASMTKAVTSVAAMQLVEAGQLDLDAPVARWLPQLEAPMVLEGDGTLRPARTPITARHLLTHTAGFGYDTWNAELAAHLAANPLPAASQPGAEFLGAPLLFEPGTAWNYGINTDWLGELVVAISGQRLGDYCAARIFKPLGMPATGFGIYDPVAVATLHVRTPDGALEARPPTPASGYQAGGAGLQSTASDYGRFLRALLGHGQLDGSQILEAATVDQMAINQTGDLDVGVVTTAAPERSNSGDLSFGHAAGFGLGFLITLETSRTGRTAGSLSWAGMFNCYYWIDPERDVAGAIYTQLLPFLDRTALDLTREFERAAYETLDGRGA